MSEILKCPKCGWSILNDIGPRSAGHLCPPLFIVIGVDGIVPDDEIEALKTDIKSGLLHTYSNYGHHNAVEAAIAYAEEQAQLSEFIEEQVVAVMSEDGKIVFFDVVAEIDVVYQVDVAEAADNE